MHPQHAEQIGTEKLMQLKVQSCPILEVLFPNGQTRVKYWMYEPLAPNLKRGWNNAKQARPAFICQE